MIIHLLKQQAYTPVKIDFWSFNSRNTILMNKVLVSYSIDLVNQIRKNKQQQQQQPMYFELLRLCLSFCISKKLIR